MCKNFIVSLLLLLLLLLLLYLCGIKGCYKCVSPPPKKNVKNRRQLEQLYGALESVFPVLRITQYGRINLMRVWNGQNRRNEYLIMCGNLSTGMCLHPPWNLKKKSK